MKLEELKQRIVTEFNKAGITLAHSYIGGLMKRYSADPEANEKVDDIHWLKDGYYLQTKEFKSKDGKTDNILIAIVKIKRTTLKGIVLVAETLRKERIYNRQFEGKSEKTIKSLIKDYLENYKL